MPPQVARDIKSVQSLKADNYGVATNNGVAVDAAGYDEAVIIFDAGTVGASGTVDVKVQESDTSGGTYTDITGASFAQVTATNDDAIYVGTIRLEGARKQFLRAVAVVGVAACDLGVSIHLAQGESKPAQTLAFGV